jgi:hypothetical protein
MIGLLDSLEEALLCDFCFENPNRKQRIEAVQDVRFELLYELAQDFF